MKALVKFASGKGNMEIRDVEEPCPRAGQVLIEVKAAGICATDVHIYDGGFETRVPVIIGHEFSGVIARLGEGVREFRLAEPVPAETTAYLCGRCPFCKSGDYNMCPERLVLGIHVNGGFTRFLVVGERYVHRLPENIDFDEGVFSEPLACSIHAVLERGEVKPNDTVLVSGPGTIGLLTMQVAKAKGCTVFVCGISKDAERLALAKRLGADVLINVDEENLEGVVKSHTNGLGADVAVECAGAARSIGQCIESLRQRGKLIQIGLAGRPLEVDFDKVANNEIHVLGSRSHTSKTWKTAMELFHQGKVKTQSLVSKKLPLSSWEEGLADAREGRGVKVILTPI